MRRFHDKIVEKYTMSDIRILLVEDELIISQDIKNILKNSGYTVIATAVSGEEAVMKALSLYPDLILMDIVLRGDMDGVDAAVKIRERLAIPIVYLTARLEKETWERAKNANPYGYVLKPLDDNMLYAAIELAMCRYSIDRKLKESEERYKYLVEHANDMIYSTDHRGYFTFVNHTAIRCMGYEENEVLGRHYLAFIHQPFRKDCAKFYDLQYEACLPNTYIELPLIAKNGALVWIGQNVQLVIENGEIIGFQAIARDITKRRQVEMALKESEERYRMVVENQTELICHSKPDGTITFVNEAYCKYFNKTRHDLIGKSFMPLLPEEDRRRADAHLKSIDRDNPIGVIEHRVIMPNGDIRWQQWTDRVIFDDAGEIDEFQSVGRDITESKNLEQKLKYLSMHDSLTGLYNRAYFDEEMRRLDSKRFFPVSIVIGDVNGLKIVNDTLGHKKGDMLITAVASILKRSFRSSDMVARIGGDEFAVLLPNTGRDVVRNSCERIQRQIEQYREQNPSMPLTFSIGYAVCENPGQRLEIVFAEADDDMYREKESQRKATTTIILNALLAQLREHDGGRVDHQTRVHRYALRLGGECGLTAADMKLLDIAAAYHDIGMIGIDGKIIRKNGHLSVDEFEEIKRHVDIGSRIASVHPALKAVADIILKHHEWWMGRGYPSGVCGEDIPLLSRIIAIADAYDAMTSDSCYRAAMSESEAMRRLTDAAATQFDPELVRKFVELNGI